MTGQGILLISLDFELYWGVSDKQTIQDYEKNLAGVENVIKEILNTFQINGIHATWATIGALFFKDINHLKDYLVARSSEEGDVAFSTDYILARIHLENRQYCFAPDLIQLIRKTPDQEIASHTFSHLCCLDSGGRLDAFYRDVAMSAEVAKNNGFRIQSIVFPRNQYHPDVLPTLGKMGITSFRGNEDGWAYRTLDAKRYNAKIKKAFRLLDAYMNMSGMHTYPLRRLAGKKPYNLKASRFLRPLPSKWTVFELLRMRRIKNAMTYAAKNQNVFHLWWHPHNFGRKTGDNIGFLNEILRHFRQLNRQYGMASLNMGEVSDLIDRFDGSVGRNTMRINGGE